jgi:hypothetical protein
MIHKEAQDATTLNHTVAPGISHERYSLRRAVGVWGSYTWGYADVVDLCAGFLKPEPIHAALAKFH